MVTQANKRLNGRRANKKANLFENPFRSGGEENKRQMVNNVLQEMIVYDGYLVCLDLRRSPQQRHQKFFLLLLELVLVFPLKRKG